MDEIQFSFFFSGFVLVPALFSCFNAAEAQQIAISPAWPAEGRDAITQTTSACRTA